MNVFLFDVMLLFVKKVSFQAKTTVGLIQFELATKIHQPEAKYYQASAIIKSLKLACLYLV